MRGPHVRSAEAESSKVVGLAVVMSRALRIICLVITMHRRSVVVQNDPPDLESPDVRSTHYARRHP